MADGRFPPDWTQHQDRARRVQIRHIRARTFRIFGVVETVLWAIGYVLMLPILAVIAFLSEGDVGLGDGGDSSSSSKRDDPRARFRTWSRYWTYHHDIELRLVDGEGRALAEQVTRPVNEAQGQRLIASALQFAAQHRLVVEERITPDADPKTVSILIGRWFGGRPMLTPPDLRAAESVEGDLQASGFSVERGDGRVVLRRVVRPHVVDAWIGLAAFIALGAIAFFAALPLLILIAVVAVIAAVMNPLQSLRGGLLYLSQLVGIPTRHEVTVTPNEVRYRSGMLKLRPRASTEGDRLLTLGYTEGLGWDRQVSYLPLRLRLVGNDRVVELPRALTDGAGQLVHDWLASTLLTLRQNTEVHDHRSQCAFCGSLYDWHEHRACPGCGGTRLDRRD
jgi:hypothetical protein